MPAVDALAVLRGRDATEDLVAAGEEPRLTNSVVVKYASVGSTAALQFLRRIAEEHHNPYTRNDAANAIAQIESWSGEPAEVMSLRGAQVRFVGTLP